MILQKVITTPKAEILVIGGLQEPVYSLGIDNRIIWFNGCGVANAPVGEWESLGFLKDITEDVAKELVDEHSVYYDGIGHRKYYGNYVDKHPFYDRATESLHSFIESNCNLKNKYGQTPKSKDFGSFTRFREMFDLWHNEQSQIFTNPFLLKKV